MRLHHALMLMILASATAAAEPHRGDAQREPAAMPNGTSGEIQPAMTPSLIVELRQRLYALGYPIRHSDPDNGPDLEKSIEQFQRTLNASPGSALTTVQIDRLRNLAPPTQWGALSYTGTGGHVGASRRHSRAAAEADTTAECTSKTRKHCRVLAVSGSQCVILIHSIYNDGYRPVVQNYIAFGQDPDALRKTALAECKGKAQISTNCDIRRVVCADGR